jgi:hypothetical protein
MSGFGGLLAALAFVLVLSAADGDWPHRRPDDDVMARGDAALHRYVPTGRPYYQQERLPKPYSFKSSPVGANGKLYLASENDDVVVARMGEKFEILVTNALKDQMFISTPAILDGEIYLRGQNTLFCIR